MSANSSSNSNSNSNLIVQPFNILPAIDLLDGQSVRLRQGVRRSAEVVSPDPKAQLASYLKAGASWVHIVNLNAAFGDFQSDAQDGPQKGILTGAQATSKVLKELLQISGLRVQLGGGVRNRAMATALLEQGVARVVVGTWAIKDPEGVCALARAYPGQIVVGLDTLGNKVTAQGWTEESGLEVAEFGRRLFENGVRLALYTQIEKDGMLTGIDSDAAGRLHASSGLQVLASGGVRDISDIQRLATTSGVAGVIVGKALAAKTLVLEDALRFERA